MAEPGNLNKSVYVVDDDRDVLDSLAFLLPVLGYDCRTFNGPQDFLAAAAGLETGCILSDLRMPGIDGFGLAAAVRSNGLDWPMVMMTSDSDPALAEHSFAAGFLAFLRKPISGDLLADALDRAFAILSG
jgi:two-component system response regulator FixJ